jgi:hypothetical protein
MNPPNSFDDTSLLALGQAFDPVLTTLKAHEPFHDWDRDGEQRTQLAEILLVLAGAGVTDRNELRSRALRSPIQNRS